jgi:hypothetical protein
MKDLSEMVAVLSTIRQYRSEVCVSLSGHSEPLSLLCFRPDNHATYSTLLLRGVNSVEPAHCRDPRIECGLHAMVQSGRCMHGFSDGVTAGSSSVPVWPAIIPVSGPGSPSAVCSRYGNPEGIG